MADKTLPPLVFGDSVADGIRKANKLQGDSRSGAGPSEVRNMILSYSLRNSLEGRDVFIGTGIPNIPEQRKQIEEQIELVRKKGGRPILIGVGPGTQKNPTTGQNEFLAELAKRNNLPFTGPLINSYPDVVKDPMGLHLRPAQYKQFVTQFYGNQQPASKVEVAPSPRKNPMTVPPPEISPEQIRNSVRIMPIPGGNPNQKFDRDPLGKDKKFDPDVYLQDPNVNKFLDYINAYEGSPKANQLVGYKEFSGFDDHPRIPVVFNKKGDVSYAAGLYQILSSTWDGQKKKLGLTDFSPTNQKRAAIGILRDIGALPDIVSGNFDKAKPKAARQWASIPGSTIGLSTGQIPRYKEEAEKILGRPTRRAGNPMMPRVEAPVEDYKPGSTLEPAPRTAQQGPATAPPQQDQVTRADMERMGPSYQAAFAAMTLGDSREDDDEYDDDETVAERYLERREMQMAQEESTLEPEEPTRTSPLASLSELSYQSPFAQEEQPVMMANGGVVRRADGSPPQGEAQAMMEDLEPTFGQRMGAKLSDVATKGLINIYDAARLTEGALSSKESAAEKEQKMSAAHKIYLDTFGFRGRRDPVTAEYFNPEEQKAIADLIAKKGGQKGSIQYKDYGFESRKTKPSNIISGQVDPYISVNKSLGQFNYELDPKTNSYRVTDQYDFNPMVDVRGRQVSSDFMGDYLSDVPGLYNKARIYAGRHMPPGTGRKVDFMVPAQVPVKRANGSPIYGEVADSGPITEDTRRAFANRQSFDPREALAALKRIGMEGVSNLESVGRRSVAALPGTVGSIESIFKEDKDRRFATGEEIERQYLPKRLTTPTKEAAGYGEIGEFIDPTIALKLAKPTAKALLKGVKSAGPQIEATLGKMAPAAEPMNIIKYEGGNWMPTSKRFIGTDVQEGSDVIKDFIANLTKDTRVGDEIKNKKFTVDLQQGVVNSDKFILQDYKNFIKRLYQDTPLLWSKMEKNKKISLAQSYKEEIIKRKQELAKSQQKVDEAQAELARPQSIANFIENKLQPYIRNNLGTPSDQVRIRMDKWELEEQPKLIAEKQKQIDKVRADIERAAAARGNIDPLILTRSQEQLRKLMNEMDGIKSRTGSFFQMGPGEREAMLRRYDMVRGSNPRGEIGTINFPATPTVAKSGLGKVWEETVDFSMEAYKPSEAASEYSSIYGLGPPQWLKRAVKSGDNKGIYSLPYRSGETLSYQFRHMIDELMSSVDPQSNLPKELRRTPKEIEKMSVDAAADLVDKINGWRASNITGLDLARANNPAVFEVKTYKTVPNTNIPNEKNLRWVEIKKPPEYRNVKKAKEVLDDALKYEGEIMKHCVGAYCPKVEEGTKIFSLRDDAGRPYTTIEAAPDMDVVEEIFKKEFGESSWTRNFKPTSDSGLLEILTQELGQTIPYKIKQIKGVRNGAPIEEVIPFVRDFVSDPKWTDVANLNLIGGL